MAQRYRWCEFDLNRCKVIGSYRCSRKGDAQTTVMTVVGM
jgi:hypothetical protein